MIRVVLGNVGSGKTASLVREIVRAEDGRHSFTNIDIFKTTNATKLNSSMIFNKERNDKGKITGYKINVDFWKAQTDKHGSINVILDEAHTLLNPRRSMSKANVVMGDWLALLRRVIGSNAHGYGELILITQLDRRLDIIAKEMATMVQFHVCHYTLTCEKCKRVFQEHNEVADKLKKCPFDNGHLFKGNHVIEVWNFKSFADFERWKEHKDKTYYKHYFITDIEEYFEHYNTLQWEDLLSDMYD